MTEHTVAQARKLGVPLDVRYTGAGAEKMCDWLGVDLKYTEQFAITSGRRWKMRGFIGNRPLQKES